MLCFICQSAFPSLKTLVAHFKKKHNLSPDEIFRCCEEGCHQIFSNLSSFKKHANRKHFSNNTSTTADFESHSLTIHQNSATVSSPTISNLDDFQYNVHDSCIETDDIFQGNNDVTSLKPLVPVFDARSALRDIANFATEFSLKLHNNNNFTRQDVFEIQDQVKKYLIKPILDACKSFAISKINDNSILNEFCDFISNFRDPFTHISSDYLLFKWLKNEDYLGDLHELTINKEITAMHKSGSLTYEEKKVTGIIMPLEFQFRKFFEKDNLLLKTTKHVKTLQNNTKLTNFVQGELWKEKSKLYPDKTILPYFLYVDEFEINNPLGSHSSVHSICNFYYSFPCLPGEDSKLRNLFLAGTVKSKDLKAYGNRNYFECLVQELRTLEINGIDVTVGENQDSKLHVHFILGLILGDNLGLNTYLDFSRSFSANFSCRLCKVHREVSKYLTFEDPELMRTVENYRSDVAIGKPDETGIFKESPLNNIPSFHVVTNYYVDVMHDIFEGVCNYVLCHIIKYCIRMKFCNLELLNSRKQNFEYGCYEIGNLCGEIKLKHLDKSKLKMSAREMMTFLSYFPLMIGDVIPSDDELWKFLINYIEIVDVLLCSEVDTADLYLLEIKIKTFESSYISLFNDHLKPKFHNLLHYVRVIIQSGPLRKLWCFKYEANHRSFKVYAHCTSSRKNICLTLAKKSQLKLAYGLFRPNLDSDETDLLIDHKYEIKGSTNIFIISEKLKIHERYLKLFSRITYNGVNYKNSDYVAHFKDEVHIHKILTIIVFNNSVLLFGQKLERIQYQDHFVAYEVDTNILGEFSVIPIRQVLGPPSTLIKTAKGKSMIRLKEHFKTFQ